ncbi:MAG: tyrosinase family protein, partial [Candidatus Nitrosopolaris sp.]
DWTRHTGDKIIGGIPKAYSEPNVDGGGPNPLYNFNSPTLALPPPRGVGKGVTFRHPDPPEDLPTSADVSAALAISDFSMFSVKLETDIHNSVHGWCHGSMGSVPTAAFDPIFWAHHCNIDRIWAIWETTHADNLPPDLTDLILSPFP